MALFLAGAALLLLAVIAVQDYLNPPLRNETISEGLSGPYHWYLDGAYIVLATALCYTFAGHGLSGVFAIAASIALMTTAVTKTFSTWVNKFANSSKLHSLFTIVMFVLMLALEGTQDHKWMWVLTGAGVVLPAAVSAFTKWFAARGVSALPIAEKMAVTLMCTWMVVWSLMH